MWSYRGLRPARSESAAIPAPPVKSGAAVPEGRTTDAGIAPLDDFGRLIARQEAVAVPPSLTIRNMRGAFSTRAASRCNRRRQKECDNRNGNKEKPVVAHQVLLPVGHP